MKIIYLSADQARALFHFLSESAHERANTLDNLGVPLFDTETGNVILTEKSEKWTVYEDSARYIEVPELSPRLISKWLTWAGSPKGQEKHWFLAGKKNEEIRNVAVDWLESVGKMKKVKYIFNIEDVSLK